MTLASIPALIAILACAALFILLYQYIFPRPAPWRVVAVALGAGLGCTALLVLGMTYFAEDTQSKLMAITSLADALPIAVFRAGLPEEAVKALAALLAIVLFRRNLTAATAFQIPLFVAVGFAIVENRGYAEAFEEFRMLIAVGRGFIATFVHSLLAMIQGVFLMRLVVQNRIATASDLPPPMAAFDTAPPSAEIAPSGSVDWSRWYFIVLGLLAAAACHSFYDWGFLPLLAEYFRTGATQPETAALPLLVGSCGIIVLFVAGLWSLRIATRRAAASDPIVSDAAHRKVVERWHLAGTALVAVGGMAFVGAIAWSIYQAKTMPPPPTAPTPTFEAMLPALIVLGSFMGAIFLAIIGWVLHQKR